MIFNKLQVNEVSGSGGAIQVDVMPEAIEANVGRMVQYIGSTAQTIDKAFVDPRDNIESEEISIDITKYGPFVIGHFDDMEGFDLYKSDIDICLDTKNKGWASYRSTAAPFNAHTIGIELNSESGSSESGESGSGGYTFPLRFYATCRHLKSDFVAHANITTHGAVQNFLIDAKKFANKVNQVEEIYDFVIINNKTFIKTLQEDLRYINPAEYGMDFSGYDDGFEFSIELSIDPIVHGNYYVYEKDRFGNVYCERIWGDINITENGTYNVLNYANANVNISGGGGTNCLRLVVDEDGILKVDNTIMSETPDLKGVKTIQEYLFYSAYCDNQNISGQALRNVDELDLICKRSLENAFSGCENITSTGLNKGKHRITLDDYALSWAFQNCTNLIDAGVNKIVQMSPGALYYCFSGCSSLRIANFENFKTLYCVGENDIDPFANTFFHCTNLTDVYFPALFHRGCDPNDDEFDGNFMRTMLNNCNGVTVHFRSELEPAMSQWPSLHEEKIFGGTNTIIAWDLGDDSSDSSGS